MMLIFLCMQNLPTYLKPYTCFKSSFIDAKKLLYINKSIKSDTLRIHRPYYFSISMTSALKFLKIIEKANIKLSYHDRHKMFFRYVGRYEVFMSKIKNLIDLQSTSHFKTELLEMIYQVIIKYKEILLDLPIKHKIRKKLLETRSVLNVQKYQRMLGLDVNCNYLPEYMYTGLQCMKRCFGENKYCSFHIYVVNQNMDQLNFYLQRDVTNVVLSYLYLY